MVELSTSFESQISLGLSGCLFQSLSMSNSFLTIVPGNNGEFSLRASHMIVNTGSIYSTATSETSDIVVSLDALNVTGKMYLGPPNSLDTLMPFVSLSVRRDACVVQGALTMHSSNLTCSNGLILPLARSFVTFTAATLIASSGGGGGNTPSVQMEKDASMLFIGYVRMKAPLVEGGTIRGTSGAQLVLPSATTFVGTYLKGSGMDSRFFLQIGDSVTFLGNVTLSFLQIFHNLDQTRAASSQSHPMIAVHGNLTFDRVSRVSGFAFDDVVMTVYPNASLVVGGMAGLEVDSGVLRLDRCRFSMLHSSQMMINSGAKLSVTNVPTLANDGDTNVGDAVLVVLGSFSFDDFTANVHTFTAHVLIELHGGIMLSVGEYPNSINFLGSVTLIYYGSASEIVAANANIYIDSLGLLGGYVSAKSCVVGELEMFDSTNVCECHTTVSRAIRFHVRQDDPQYLLTVTDDLVMAEGSEIEWHDPPGTSAPLTIEGTLNVRSNVTLKIPFAPAVHASVWIIQLVSFPNSPMFGSFATITTPQGWSVNTTTSGIYLTRSFLPISTTISALSLLSTTTTTGTMVPTSTPAPNLGMLLGLSIGGGVLVIFLIVVFIVMFRVKRARDKARFLNIDIVNDTSEGETRKLIHPI